MIAVDQSKARRRRRDGGGGVKVARTLIDSDRNVCRLTLHCTASSFTKMGMGSPENRPKGADDSYRTTWR